MHATCGNCQRGFDVELTRGHEAQDAQPDCTYCGVNNRWRWTPMTDLRPVPPDTLLDRLRRANPVEIGGDG